MAPLHRRAPIAILAALASCSDSKPPAAVNTPVDAGGTPDGGGSDTDGPFSGDSPIDADTIYADQTELVYLSGKGSADAVDWDFMINSGQQAGIWSTLPVPSNWELHGFGTLTYGLNSYSTEVGTYRRAFDVPAAWADKQVFLVFEGCMTDTAVTINGASAGAVHQGAFYRFKYDVTSLIVAGSNQLEVVVSEQSADASVNAAEREADYWTFGGIFRPVYLEAYPRQSIERIAIDADASGDLKLDVHLRNVTEAAQLTARLLDSNLVPVGDPITVALEPDAPLPSAPGPAAPRVATLTGTFPGAELWSAESPRRHRLAVELETAGGTRHAVRENFGFRSVEVRAGDGIYVNGAKVILRGANRHSFWPSSGRALDPSVSLMDAQIIKDMNMNAVRSSHYPADKHFLDRADAIGLYVLDELAGWQAPPYDTAVGQRLVEEMVTFNVNHPSIVFWDNGNENGWNPALDAEFPRWDPQGRPVLHPQATFSDINTAHYQTYANTVGLLGGATLFMPTEFLHGLYDGGGGAGLDDYWAATLASPRGAGGFLWALIDEGVAWPPGQIDTAGNSAPDGLLGPYREKEGSYHTVRQIWSPVQIALAELPESFDGNLEVQNRYDMTDLASVRFDWKLVSFDFLDPDAGHTVRSQGVARTGSIAPRATGSLSLGLPSDWGGAQALLLDATDATNRLIGRWSWMLATPSEVRASIVGPASIVSPASAAGSATVTDDGVLLSVAVSGKTYSFTRADGTLAGVSAGGQTFALLNGPTLSAGTATLQSFTGAEEGNEYVITATYTGNLEQVVWRVRADGWLALSYRYSLQGAFDYFGVDFDCPEARVSGVQWLGRGPYRVWKNRMKGPWHDLWQRAKNDAITGQVWDYPEFKGYFSDVYWARLATDDGPIEIVMDSPGLFLRLYTPSNGPNPQTATMSFPSHDLSLLHGIAPIGEKFLPAEQHGPQSAQNQVNGTYSATVFLRFGAKTSD